MNFPGTLRLFVACLFLLTALPIRTAYVQTSTLPNPVLMLISVDVVDNKGKAKDVTRYIFSVTNSEAYPAEMFAAAPALPPCGSNTKASRTWVDLFDASGKRLNGFCALAKPSDLNSIWFTLEAGQLPPSYVYIEMNDRQTNTKYKSNLAETTL